MVIIALMPPKFALSLAQRAETRSGGPEEGRGAGLEFVVRPFTEPYRYREIGALSSSVTTLTSNVGVA